MDNKYYIPGCKGAEGASDTVRCVVGRKVSPEAGEFAGGIDAPLGGRDIAANRHRSSD
jgi:hypothetical protein